MHNIESFNKKNIRMGFLTNADTYGYVICVLQPMSEEECLIHREREEMNMKPMCDSMTKHKNSKTQIHANHFNYSTHIHKKSESNNFESQISITKKKNHD